MHIAQSENSFQRNQNTEHEKNVCLPLFFYSLTNITHMLSHTHTHKFKIALFLSPSIVIPHPPRFAVFAV